MTLEETLRLLIPIVLAVFAAYSADRLLVLRGLQPPGFRDAGRRFLGGALIAVILWIGVFSSLGTIGQKVEPTDYKNLPTAQLFLLHALLLATIGLWFGLGYAGVRRPSPPRPPSPAPPPPSLGEGGDEIVMAETTEPPYSLSPGGERGNGIDPGPPPVSLGRQFLAQFGLLAPNIPREIGIGLLIGAGAWVVVLVAVIVIGMILIALGGEQAIPKQPPALIPFLVGLPLWIRLAISLSAGVVEELFFRGFLQPRVGIALSTLLFVFAHFSYGQPLMLVGIATLSLIYGLLVQWRQTIWPAIAAHALFDGVQLLVIIPAALKFMEKEAPKAVLFFFGN